MRRDRTTRRTALQTLGAATAAAAAAATARPADASWLTTRRTSTPLVFRLRTRNRTSCNACREHHKYIVATSRALLNEHRAHPGCDCPITRQEVSPREFRKWFPTESGVVDLRWFG